MNGQGHKVFRRPGSLRPGMGIGAILLLMTVCGSTPVSAGDFAERNIIGFSPDGGIFAFEQYGTHDGSGFPYSEIFVNDTKRDKWVANTPIRLRIDDEAATVAQARQQASTQATPVVTNLNVTKPGRLLAHNPPSELSADPHALTVNAVQTVPPSEEPWHFTLEEIPLQASHCPDLGGETLQGFRLQVRQGDGPATVWHADAAIPESRKCPLRYAISDVIIADLDGGPRVFAVLISVFSIGFEGPDRRFIAITRHAP